MADLIPNPKRIDNNDAGWLARSIINGFNSLVSAAINKLSSDKVDRTEMANYGYGVKRYKEAVNTVADLPKTGNEEGDGRVVKSDLTPDGKYSYVHLWDGTKWGKTPLIILTSDVATKPEVDAQAQTNLFGKSATFGLDDSASIEIIKNTIRDIYISNESVELDSLAVLAFGISEINPRFFLDIANMQGKEDSDLVTANERFIRCLIEPQDVPRGGIQRFDLKFYETNTIIGWVELDFSLYYSNPVYLGTGIQKTFIQSKINIDGKLRYQIDVSKVKDIKDISKEVTDVASQISVHREIFQEKETSKVYDGSVSDDSIDGYISTESGNYAGVTTGTQGFKHIVIDVVAGEKLIVSRRNNMGSATQKFDNIQFLTDYDFVEGNKAPVVSTVQGDGSYMVPLGANLAFIWVKSPNADDTKTVKVEIEKKDGILPRLDKLESVTNAKCYVKNNINNIQVYTQSKSDASKYIMFQITHEVDNSEIVYKDLWRITNGGIYKLDNGVFTSLNIALVTSGENEFAMKFRNKGDYTGGTHGDERIDTDGSFVLFNIDGVPLSEEQLSKSFLLECSTFDYTQYSTLHETTVNGTTPIEGHPIVAKHLKRTSFNNKGYVNYNMVKIEVQSYLDQYHSGLYCTHKATATSAMLSDPKILSLTGSDSTFLSDYINSLVSFWNSNNNVSVDITSRFISGLDDFILKPKVWDRPTDSKYYRRLENMNMLVEVGHIIENEMKIEYR